MYISYLYVQTVTRQCFCFPNSQWGVAHQFYQAAGQDTEPTCIVATASCNAM